MSTLIASALALGGSALSLTVLALRDPKRLRNESSSHFKPLTRNQRRLLGWLVPVPGLVLVIIAAWPALLIWLGTSCSLGWALTQWLAPAGDDLPAEADLD